MSTDGVPGDRLAHRTHPTDAAAAVATGATTEITPASSVAITVNKAACLPGLIVRPSIATNTTNQGARRRGNAQVGERVSHGYHPPAVQEGRAPRTRR